MTMMRREASLVTVAADNSELSERGADTCKGACISRKRRAAPNPHYLPGAGERSSDEPYAYLTDVLQRMVDGHSVNRLDELLPWAWKAGNPVKT
jgi:IS66 C-terminal element